MRTRLVGLLFLLVSCAVAKAAAPSGPGGIRVTEALAPGDTLAYVVSWTAGLRAASYDFTVSVAATNGTWTAVFGTTPAGALPATGNTTALTFSPKLIAIPWDSATFTVTVSSRNPAGVSSPASATWTVRRKPGPPGLPKVDSTATVTGTLVLPPISSFALGASGPICAFKQFASGAVVEWTTGKALCDSIYVRYVPAAARALVTPALQAHTDSLGVTCVTWVSALPAAVQVMPLATCSPAATLLGLGVTRRQAVDALRYAIR